MFNHESGQMMTYDITRDLLYLRTTSPEGLTFFDHHILSYRNHLLIRIQLLN